MSRQSGVFVCYDCGQEFSRTLIRRVTVTTSHSYGGLICNRSRTAKVSLCPDCASKRRADNLGCLLVLLGLVLLVMLRVCYG